jgi:hypothetical protein
MAIRSVFALCCIAAATALSPAAPVEAQDSGDEALDTVVVTGSRIGYRDLLDTPAVSLTKPGDFLLQSIVLTNDSRDEAMRRREIHETIAQLIAAAGNRYTLLHQDEVRVTLTRENYRVDVADEGKRPDTSMVTLQVRVGVGGDPAKADAIIADMRRFVRSAAKVGRTEIEIRGDTSLVMNRPERFRYELIEAIAKDSRKLLETMALDCRIEIEGLNSRVEWERASAAELLLYIPYSIAISDCRAAARQP